MWQDDILFYNVDALVSAPEYPGQLLSRFPPSLIVQMDVPLPAQFSRGCELRFWQMPSDTPTTIYLYAMGEDGQAVVLFGEHVTKEFTILEGCILPIEITPDPIYYNHVAVDATAQHLRFSNTLCRVFLNNEAKICYCGKNALTAQAAQFGAPIVSTVNTLQPTPMPFVPLFCEDGSRNLAKALGVTPPPTSVPPVQFAPPPKGEHAMRANKRFLAYGSSITHGASASSNYLSYIQLTAQNLGLDVLNFGMSGGCTCDYAMADYIASVPEVDFYFLELGVNMRHRYYVEEFEARLIYLLQKLQGRKVYLTTLYPNRASCLEVENALAPQEKAFNALIRKHAPVFGVHLLEGADILKDPAWLTHDWIHPSSYGHIKMAEQLTKLLEQERNF